MKNEREQRNHAFMIFICVLFVHASFPFLSFFSFKRNTRSWVLGSWGAERILKVTKNPGNRGRCRKLSLWDWCFLIFFLLLSLFFCNERSERNERMEARKEQSTTRKRTEKRRWPKIYNGNSCFILLRSHSITISITNLGLSSTYFGSGDVACVLFPCAVLN